MLGVHLNPQHTEVTIITCPEETVVIRGYRLLEVYRSIANHSEITNSTGGEAPAITSITVEENAEIDNIN